MVLQSNVEIPTENVRIQVPNTHLYIEDNDYGAGTLFVAESNLVWRLENGDGLCLEYPHISLHAVSSDLNAFPHECLYLILDTNILSKSSSMEEGQEGYQQDEEEECTELRFVPEDKTTLQSLFLSMNHCQALYPDTMSASEDEGQEDDQEDEGDDEEYTDAPDLQIIGTGQQIFQRMQYDENNGHDHQAVKNGNGDHNSDIDQFEDAD